MTRSMRRLILLLIVLFFAGFTLGACPSWKPMEGDGKCNAGRTWQKSVEQDGKWKEGYCKDAL